MNAEPPAIVEPGVETEADFRRWVRDEFRHQRDMQAHTNAALELILKTLQAMEDADAE